jgi:hypothetical protein
MAKSRKVPYNHVFDRNGLQYGGPGESGLSKLSPSLVDALLPARLKPDGQTFERAGWRSIDDLKNPRAQKAMVLGDPEINFNAKDYKGVRDYIIKAWKADHHHILGLDDFAKALTGRDREYIAQVVGRLRKEKGHYLGDHKNNLAPAYDFNLRLRQLGIDHGHIHDLLRKVERPDWQTLGRKELYDALSTFADQSLSVVQQQLAHRISLVQSKYPELDTPAKLKSWMQKNPAEAANIGNSPFSKKPTLPTEPIPITRQQQVAEVFNVGKPQLKALNGGLHVEHVKAPTALKAFIAGSGGKVAAGILAAAPVIGALFDGQSAIAGTQEAFNGKTNTDKLSGTIKGLSGAIGLASLVPPVAPIAAPASAVLAGAAEAIKTNANYKQKSKLQAEELIPTPKPVMANTPTGVAKVVPTKPAQPLNLMNELKYGAGQIRLGRIPWFN